MSHMGKIYTIGFTGKSAEKFFLLLEENNIKGLIDVRLNNTSQMAAFTKKEDLKYFLKKILFCNYTHRPDFAPTDEILKKYKSKSINWTSYKEEYNRLLNTRNIISHIKKENIIDNVFLCSEHNPEYCHRKLLAEYFQSNWNDIEIIHLL